MIIGNKIYHKKTCKNSIEWAKSKINEDPDGTVYIVDTMDSARGRQGRQWVVQPGQLLVTILLKPENLTNININFINMAFSLAVLNSIKSYGTKLKWPNDFFIDQKKVGGILFESVWCGNNLMAVIVGFALNVNNSNLGYELQNVATSLTNVVNRKIDTSELLTSILKNCEHFYNFWRLGDYQNIYKYWKDAQLLNREIIKVHTLDGVLKTGLVKDFLPSGDLVLEINSGKNIVLPFYIVNNCILQ
ncbi:biotin--[acetyl-CoA-carboxylase] ligase [Candidatus Babeliales bacterium]|nr:biotin--[acetyl-CoA-carboxylase] ligase [Candidatus Babeliales bacterium]